MEEFKDKTIIITGGASGIGRATAELFAEKGANICIADVNDVDGNKLEQKLNKEGRSVKFFKTDVTDFKELETIVIETIKLFKSIDILFNSAGFEGRIKAIKDTTLEEWDEIMGLHLKSCFMACKLVIPHMTKQGSGVIINIGSEIGTSFRFAPNYVPYGTSKAAVMAFTKALAVELAPSKIRVNCVSPGAIKTAMLEREIEKWLERGLFKTREAALGSINSSYPIGFIGEPIDIAYAVVFLALEKSRYTTGTILSVDGGSGII